MENKDCFAYEEGKCNALNELYCKQGKCAFYKNKNDFSLDSLEESINKYLERRENKNDKK